jgi:hypothetical protein
MTTKSKLWLTVISLLCVIEQLLKIIIFVRTTFLVFETIVFFCMKSQCTLACMGHILLG